MGYGQHAQKQQAPCEVRPRKGLAVCSFLFSMRSSAFRTGIRFFLRLFRFVLQVDAVFDVPDLEEQEIRHHGLER